MERKNKILPRLMIYKNQGSISMFLAIILTAIIIVGGSVSSLSLVSKESDDVASQMKESLDIMAKGTPIIKQQTNSHATGFLPPEMDLSHLTGQEIPEKYISETPPSSFDWRTYGKVTSVKDQLKANTCWAFASLGCFESKILIHGGGTYDLSEDNLKECGPYHLCTGEGNFYKVANYLSQDGTVLESCDPYQDKHNNNPPCGTCPYQQTLLDWRVISGNSVPSTNVLKTYIYNEGPVYTSLWAGNKSIDPDWYDEFHNYTGDHTLYYQYSGTTNHAVLIVGWDDSLTHAGGTGGWICKNSWGTNWGGTCGYGTQKGYFTIAYGSAAIGKYSSFVDQWGKYDTSGGISYYDEKGWNYNWGYSSNTAWGLCKYGFMIDAVISRVEFWTTDETTDVDVYIYDDFDGSTLSNLLWSSLDHAFSEAGYHGVAIVPPMQMMGMNAFYVVVKFTNKNYQYPVASDRDGPTLTGFTYTSADGSSGSWFDRETGSPKSDVAIRVRVSGDNPPSNPTITGPASGSAGKSYNYNFVSTDMDGDKVSYYIKWGDGTETDWTPFQNSGITYTEGHTWGSQGTYAIIAKARDIYGVESDWSNYVVEMPVSYQSSQHSSAIQGIQKSTNVFSLNGENIESLSRDQKELEYSENSISGCIPVYKAYGYAGYNPGGEEGLYGFDLYPFGNFTYLGFGGGGDFLNGACFVPPCYIYFTQYGSGIIFVLNIVTWDFFSVGGGGNGLNGIDYDDESGNLYGVSSYALYKIDLESGEQYYIGGWGASYMMITLAINNGICYGLDLVTDSIYLIDLDTAELTFFGYTGLSLNYAQALGFDKDNNILYLAAYTSTGQLYKVNLTTGTCTLIGNFPNGMEITGLAIIYGNIPPYVPCDPYPKDGENDIPLNVTLSWKGGDYTPEDIVTYDVYFGVSYPPAQQTKNQTETTYDPYGPNNLIPYQKYYWQTVAWDNHGLCTPGPIWNFTTAYGPKPPSAPIITGPKQGRVGIKYEWTFVSTDPEEKNITYYIDWGDECGGAEYHGPYPSGEEVTLAHTYTRKNTFIINAIAINEYGAESNVTYYEVMIPRNRMLPNFLFLRFLEKFPVLQRLLDDFWEVV